MGGGVLLVGRMMIRPTSSRAFIVNYPRSVSTKNPLPNIRHPAFDIHPWAKKKAGPTGPAWHLRFFILV